MLHTAHLRLNAPFLNIYFRGPHLDEKCPVHANYHCSKKTLIKKCSFSKGRVNKG